MGAMAGCRGKIRYRDRLGAMIALASTERASKAGNTRREERRMYHCPHCRGWHTTSQAARDAA